MPPFTLELPSSEPPAPRALRTPLVDRLEADPASVDPAEIGPRLVAEVRANRGHDLVPFTGQSAGLVHDVAPAAEIVSRLMAEAKAALTAATASLAEGRSPGDSAPARRAALEELDFARGARRITSPHVQAPLVRPGALRFAQVGRTFYREEPLLEPLRLVAEDDTREVQVRPRRLHIGVAGLRHQRHRVRAGGRVVRDRRVPR